ncbi:MAG TPA: hypothetical protein VFT92_04380, partial [Nitrospira sp.]|nr:hypothetical protein [Nitrospira sp.]
MGTRKLYREPSITFSLSAWIQIGARKDLYDLLTLLKEQPRNEEPLPRATSQLVSQLQQRLPIKICAHKIEGALAR